MKLKKFSQKIGSKIAEIQKKFSDNKKVKKVKKEATIMKDGVKEGYEKTKKKLNSKKKNVRKKQKNIK